MSKRCGPGGIQSCHDLAMNHIVLASKRAAENNHDKADYHIESALTFADMHKKQLERQGRHDEAKEYLGGINDHVGRIRRMRQNIKKADACKEDHSKVAKGDSCKCGYMNKTDLAKGFLAPEARLQSIKPKDLVSAGTEKQQVGKPKGDPRYDYRAIHDLHPHDQKLAQEKFGGKDIGAYHYPVDKQTGRLAHAVRAPATGAPKAQPSSYQELQPHHMPGATVQVTSPGYKGFGIVRPSHPEMPGKIAVQVGHKDHHKIYVEPHHITPKKPTERVEKALVTLHNIRKAFFKNDSTKDS